jgi:amidohydrolase
MQKRIFEALDQVRDEIIELSRNIHAHPELCFEEHASAGFITELLERHGFDIERGTGGLETAFRATFEGREPGPTVAFLAEYDALPEIGHGCGHNLIAAVAAGAGIALSKVMEELPGRVVVLGTPAEEGGGGKVLLLEGGGFEGIDYALMVHPSTEALIGRGGLAITNLKLSFRGKAAHSASPEEGVNALQGLIQTFNMIDSLRAQFPFKATVNGIITSGGSASNIIPDYAAGTFSVRARTVGDLKYVMKLVRGAIRAAETLTGAQAEYSTSKVYAERYPNLSIGESFKKYMEQQGETVNYPDPNAKIGSSDIGNVTLQMPAIHAYFAIADEGVTAHSAEFTRAAVTDRAHESALKTAKALACAGYEILTDEELRGKIAREFEETVPHYDSLELE